MVDQGYALSASDHCVHVKKLDSDDFIVILIYIDDMFIVRRDKSKIEKLKKELSKSFDMKDLRLASHILRMKISRDRKTRRHGYHRRATFRRYYKDSVSIRPSQFIFLSQIISN